MAAPGVGTGPWEQGLSCLLAGFHILCHSALVVVLTFDDLGISKGCFASIGM